MYDTILDRWEITAEELTDIVDANPSLRGFMIGGIILQSTSCNALDPY